MSRRPSFPDEAALVAFSRRRFLTKTVTGAATVAGLLALGMPNQALAAPFNALTSGSSVLPTNEHGLELILGHDLSTLQQLESVGKTFSDHGRVQPLERIMAHHGANYVRERLWVNPPMPFNDLPHVLKMARRIKEAGMKFLLDFHYSDFWADPGKQFTPQSWTGQHCVQLYTRCT